MSLSLLYITAGSLEEARRIGRSLVEEKLAACANIFGPATAIYRWEGAVQEAEETILIAKTRTELVESVVVRVKQLHSYSCPCVVAIPIAEGNRDFLAWIETEVER